MKEQKLISMVDFVLINVRPFMTDKEVFNALDKLEDYANFLKQPLTLGMFVPCDLEGNVLEEPKKYHLFKKGIRNGETTDWIKECQQYQQAKERVLFEHEFSIENIKRWCEDETVEFLVEMDVFLTPTACKQIGWE